MAARSAREMASLPIAVLRVRPVKPDIAARGAVTDRHLDTLDWIARYR